MENYGNFANILEGVVSKSALGEEDNLEQGAVSEDEAELVKETGNVCRTHDQNINAEENPTTPSGNTHTMSKPMPSPGGAAFASLSMSDIEETPFPPSETVTEVELAFVNREQSARDVFKILHSNTLAPSLSNYRLPLILQHYGSGKTTFTQKLIDLWKAYNIGSGSWLREAVFVHVDLRSTESVLREHGNSLGASKVLLIIVLHHLKHALQALNRKKYGQVIAELNDYLGGATQISAYFIAELSRKHDLKLLLSFDEIDAAITADVEDVKGWTSGHSQTAMIERIYLIMRFLSDLMGFDSYKTNISVIASGKSALFYRIGRKRLHDFEAIHKALFSPFLVEHIVLPPLHANHVKNLLMNSTVTTESKKTWRFSSVLESLSIDLEEFTNALITYTGGIPRPIAICMQQLAIHKSHVTGVEAFLTGIGFRAQKYADLMLSENSPWLYTCIYLSVYDITVPLYEMLELPGHGNKFIYEILEETGIYYYTGVAREVTQGEPGNIYVRVKVPKFSMLMLNANAMQHDFIREIKPYKDSGTFFEYVWLHALCKHQMMAASRKSSWKEIAGSIFEHTFFKDELVPPITRGFLRRTPGFSDSSSKESLDKLEMEDPWKYNLKPSAGSFEWTTTHIASPACYMLPPNGSKSHDLGYLLSREHCVLYQFKFQKDYKVTTNTIVKELQKVIPLITTMQRVTFIVSCTGYSAGIRKLIGERDTLHYSFGKGIKFEGKKGTQVVTLPQNMELVIVSEPALCKFLGVDNFIALQKLKTYKKEMFANKEELQMMFTLARQDKQQPETAAVTTTTIQPTAANQSGLNKAPFTLRNWLKSFLPSDSLEPIEEMFEQQSWVSFLACKNMDEANLDEIESKSSRKFNRLERRLILNASARLGLPQSQFYNSSFTVKCGGQTQSFTTDSRFEDILLFFGLDPKAVKWALLINNAVVFPSSIHASPERLQGKTVEIKIMKAL